MCAQVEVLCGNLSWSVPFLWLWRGSFWYCIFCPSAFTSCFLLCTFALLPVTLPGTNAWRLAITWGKPVFLVWLSIRALRLWAFCLPGFFLTALIAFSQSFRLFLCFGRGHFSGPFWCGYFRNRLFATFCLYLCLLPLLFSCLLALYIAFLAYFCLFSLL